MITYVPITTNDTSTAIWGTNSGSSITFSVSESSVETNNGSSGVKSTIISPRLYFSFVKSKMGKVEKEKYKKSAQKLQALIRQAKEINQVGMAEQLAKRLQIVVAEMEMAAYGIEKYVDYNDIIKFKDKVKDRTIDFVNLTNFPRTVPAKVRTKITKLQKAGIFDEFWILFNNPKREVAKTIKQEKDPILFGKLNGLSARYYYIDDWVDEYCDLTLDEFVNEMKKVDADYLPTQLPEIDEKFIKEVIDEVKTMASSSRMMLPEEKKKEVRLGVFQKIAAWFSNLGEKIWKKKSNS